MVQEKDVFSMERSLKEVERSWYRSIWHYEGPANPVRRVTKLCVRILPVILSGVSNLSSALATWGKLIE